MRIAVLLPVKNGARFIEESVRSVLAQSHADLKLYICNDGSSDNTSALLDRFNDPRMQIITLGKSAGQFAAFNLLLKNCPEKLVHFWSHDDRMHTDCLEETIRFHKQHPQIGMSYCGTDNMDERGAVLQKWKSDATPSLLDRKTYARFTLAFGCLGGSISQVTLNRQVTGTNLLFDPSMQHSGDFDLWTRIAGLSAIGFINQSLMAIRCHTGQVTRNYQNSYFSVVEGLPIVQRMMPWACLDKKEETSVLYSLLYPLYIDRLFSLLKKGRILLGWRGLAYMAGQDNMFRMIYCWFRYRFGPAKAWQMRRNSIMQKLFVASCRL